MNTLHYNCGWTNLGGHFEYKYYNVLPYLLKVQRRNDVKM